LKQVALLLSKWNQFSYTALPLLRLVTRLITPLVVDYSASRRLVVDYSSSCRHVIDYFASAARSGASSRRAAR
jgi:hypothetical protein